MRFRIFRYDPDKDEKPAMRDYDVALDPHDRMLLDALVRIKEHAVVRIERDVVVPHRGLFVLVRVVAENPEAHFFPQSGWVSRFVPSARWSERSAASCAPACTRAGRRP